MTRDRNTLLNLLPTLSPAIMPVRGSNLAAALEKAKELLSQGGHLQGDIILMTDGVDSRQLNAAKQAIEGSHYRLGILAIGSSQGAPIRLPDGQLLKDSRNEVVVPATDFGMLSELASAGNGILVPYSNDGKDLQTLQQWLATSSDATETDLAGDTWVDLGPYLAFLLLLPLLLSFRIGLPVLLLPLSLGLLVSPPSQASGWDDLWQTRISREYRHSSRRILPLLPTSLLTRPGKAAPATAAAIIKARCKLRARWQCHRLIQPRQCLMQLGQYEEAIKRYSDALTQVPDMQDAIDNKALAESLLKQREQREQQQDQQSQDKQEDQSQQDQQQNSQSGKDQSQGSQDSAQGDNSQGQNQDKEQGQDSQADQAQARTRTRAQIKTLTKRIASLPLPTRSKMMLTMPLRRTPRRTPKAIRTRKMPRITLAQALSLRCRLHCHKSKSRKMSQAQLQVKTVQLSRMVQRLMPTRPTRRALPSNKKGQTMSKAMSSLRHKLPPHHSMTPSPCPLKWSGR